MPSNRNLRLTPAANADLTDLLQQSAELWGEEQMLAYATKIYGALEHLARFPFLGRARDDLAKGLRGHQVGQHIVFYRVTEDEVIIRRIVHHQRDIDTSVGIATLSHSRIPVICVKAKERSMSVTLDPEVEAKVQRKVDEGLYADANTVVLKALELLDRQDQHERLRALIREGEEGEGIPYTPELLEAIDREAEERFLRGELPSPDVWP